MESLYQPDDLPVPPAVANTVPHGLPSDPEPEEPEQPADPEG